MGLLSEMQERIAELEAELAKAKEARREALSALRDARDMNVMATKERDRMVEEQAALLNACEFYDREPEVMLRFLENKEYEIAGFKLREELAALREVAEAARGAGDMIAMGRYELLDDALAEYDALKGKDE